MAFDVFHGEPKSRKQSRQQPRQRSRKRFQEKTITRLWWTLQQQNGVEPVCSTPRKEERQERENKIIKKAADGGRAFTAYRVT
jgi:hypothetical protein